jgi:hypothetical protein
MIPKKPAPDLIWGGGSRFSEKIMLKQKSRQPLLAAASIDHAA